MSTDQIVWFDPNDNLPYASEGKVRSNTPLDYDGIFKYSDAIFIKLKNGLNIIGWLRVNTGDMGLISKYHRDSNVRLLPNNICFQSMVSVRPFDPSELQAWGYIQGCPLSLSLKF